MKKIIENKLQTGSIFLFSILLLGITFVVRVITHSLKYIFNIPDFKFRKELIDQSFEVNFDLLLSTLLFAPILETLVFQSLFYYFLIKFNISRSVIIILSSLTFGAIHNYSLIYIIDATLIGAIFMYCYILRAEANKNPFLSTAVAHGTINLIAIVATLITHYYKFGTFF